MLQHRVAPRRTLLQRLVAPRRTLLQRLVAPRRTLLQRHIASQFAKLQRPARAPQDSAAADGRETIASLTASPAGRCRLDHLAAALAPRFVAEIAGIAAAAPPSPPADPRSERLGPPESAPPAGRPAFALSESDAPPWPSRAASRQ